MPDLQHPAAHRPGHGDPDWSAMRRVLVVRPDNVGDVLMTGPVLRALRAAAPRAALDLLASPAGAAAAALLPDVDGVVTASVSWQQLDLVPGADPDAALVAELAGRGYDAAVVLTSFSQSPWPAAEVARRAGIPTRIGMSKEFGGGLLTHWVPEPDDGEHQVDRMLGLLAAVGVPSQGHTLSARIPDDAATPLAVVGARYAVVAPGASCPSRRWPAERFAAVVRGLADDGLTVAVTGTDREADLVATVAGDVGVPLAGGLGLGDLAALLAGAEVVVANNSGSVHLADAVGAPVVELFAGTETVDQYRPRSTTAEVLTRPVSCAPCRQLVCPFGQECLAISPDEVVAAARRLRAVAVR
ncbi:glycosyl transferase [Actinomycetospora sp. NBRC 106375]|uniref:glycosyltransferase family 9 protein n=1 Tax=Actinomycetospora sp. NBRC 106375 TaxID=3032207 RepID=UPI0024A58E9A|nr:glycosyltransferase family 9 protein [Actinomycetospora sp. NBRC 106375]GLZ46109.1 glycosyl transferase [Actinomycetospora sp. NBRC 106375]